MEKRKNRENDTQLDNVFGMKKQERQWVGDDRFILLGRLLPSVSAVHATHLGESNDDVAVLEPVIRSDLAVALLKGELN